MTAHRDLKRIIRDRQAKTGESYTTARTHVLRERAARLGGDGARPEVEPARCEAAVLKLNRQSARVRVLGEDGQVTLRSPDLWRVAPGHLVTLVIDKRWTFRGDAYASGRIESPRIDVARLGLEPLPLTGGELDDIAATSEPYRDPDPYAPLWRRFTSRPRPSFELDGIAWGEGLPGLDPDENPTCEAAERRDEGDVAAAYALLMDAIGRDLRCLDAHAHLGNLEFERAPERAITHYEIGVRIGELSVPAGFDGVLVWGRIYNRPFLRCLHGYALCLWRLGRLDDARQVFERMLALNPDDHQGARFCWHDVRARRSWDVAQAGEQRGRGGTTARS